MSSSPYPSRSADGGAPGEPGAPFTYPSRPVVLVIDDEAGVRESLRIILQDDFEVLEAADGAAALEIVRSRRIDVALLDVRMPGESGPAVLPRILALSETIAVILMTAVPQVRTAVDAMKAGAYDYVIKPFEPDEILLLVRQAAQHRLLEREVRYLRSEFDRAHGFDALVGRHARMARLYELIAQVAPTPVTVLITAESGTGKELVARAIHRQSLRRDQPFVAVNLAAIPDTLLESELFGHEKGAFTGAHARKAGKFELAHGGTLFLDEVGSLRIDLQAKLSAHCRSARSSASAASAPPRGRPGHRRDQYRPQAGGAGADVPRRPLLSPQRRSLSVPPLRDRKEDIALLVDHFVKKYSREFKKDVRGVSQGALPALEAYDWPGNVRELENVIERSVALATRPVILLEDLPLDLAMHEPGQSRSVGEPSQLSLKEARERFEQAYVLRALEREDWNQSRTARILGVHRNTLIAAARRRGASVRRAGASSGRGWWGSRGRARRRRKGSSPEPEQASLGDGGRAPRPWTRFGLASCGSPVGSSPAVPRSPRCLPGSSTCPESGRGRGMAGRSAGAASR
jgi:two-component system response regulator AtoC